MTPTGIVVGVLVAGVLLAASWARTHGHARRVRVRLVPARAVPNARPGPLSVLPPPAWLTRALAEADVATSADRIWTAWLAGIAIAACGAAVVGGPAFSLLALVAATVVPPAVLRSQRGRRRAVLEAGLPAALEAIARSLRSGASLRQAVTEAASATPGVLGEELRRVAADAESGSSLVAALEDLASRQPLPGVRLAVAALCLGAETGGAQARAVDGVASTLRERLAVGAEVRALSSQTRASMVVIALAPLAFCAFASATDRRTSTFLFRTPVGLACVVVGIGLDAVGALWMQRLSRVPA